MRNRTWLHAAVALALLATILLSVAPARALGSTVTPDIGPPGTSFAFTAEGFAPNEIVRVVFEVPGRGTVRFADAAGFDIPIFADANGKASWTYTVPGDFPSGTYIAVVQNLSQQVRRRIGFLVQAGVAPADIPAPQPSGDVLRRPEIGPPGTLFSFRTSGFLPAERVAIWVHAPDGSVSDLPVDLSGQTAFFASRSGELQWVVATPPTTPDGRYVAVAVGVTSGQTRVVDFTVRVGVGQVAPAPTDNAFVTPESGPPGTSFHFTATGFFPNEGVGIWIHRPDGSISTVTADGKAVQADGQGIATWSVTAGTGLPDGVYAMVAQGISSTQVRVRRFEVRR